MEPKIMLILASDENGYDNVEFEPFDDIEFEPLDEGDHLSLELKALLAEVDELEQLEYRKITQHLEKHLEKQLEKQLEEQLEEQAVNNSEIKDLLAEVEELEQIETRRITQRLEKQLEKHLEKQTAKTDDIKDLLAEVDQLDQIETRRITQRLEKQLERQLEKQALKNGQTNPLTTGKLTKQHLEDSFPPEIKDKDLTSQLLEQVVALENATVTKQTAKLVAHKGTSKHTTKLSEMDLYFEQEISETPANNIVCPKCNLINGLTNKRCRRCATKLRKSLAYRFFNNIPVRLSVGKIIAITAVTLSTIITVHALRPRPLPERAVKLTYPANQMVIEQSKIILEWQGTDEFYSVQVVQGGKKILERCTPETRYILSAEERAQLKPGREYKWQIIPKKLNGQVLPYKTEQFGFFVLAR